MNRLLLLVFVLSLAWAWEAWGQEGPEENPKTALVNIQELFQGYYKTDQAEEQINIERARIQKENNALVQRIKGLDKSLRELTQALQAADLEEDQRKSLRREAGLRFQEREMLERKRSATVQAQHRELNQKMIARMKGILREIRRVIEEMADETGYDYVFDVDGLNSSQVPFVLYAKDATDITALIREELRKGAPAKK
jgi:outer membrane protein